MFVARSPTQLLVGGGCNDRSRWVPQQGQLIHFGLQSRGGDETLEIKDIFTFLYTAPPKRDVPFRTAVPFLGQIARN